MFFSQAVNVSQKVSLRERVERQPRLVQQKDNLSLGRIDSFLWFPAFSRLLGVSVKLMLNAVKPNQKTKEPDETPTALLKRRAYAAMTPIFDSKVEVRAIVVRRFILQIRLDIHFDFQIFILFPELHDLIG